MRDLTYRPHIDGLRAIAVLAVVAYHAHAPGVGGGFVGVDVFFVISGFLITALLFREFEQHGDISLIGFYERRIRRLAPALLVVLAATMLLGAIFLTPIAGEQQGLAKSAIATIALMSNLYFAHTAGDYFAGPAEAQPLLHTWSLSVEEQFYLVWPLALLVIARSSRARRIGSELSVGAALLVIFSASLALSIATTPSDPGFAFYGSPTRAWEFAAGGLAYFLVRKRTAPVPLAQPLAWIGLLAILWAIVGYTDTIPFPGYQAALPVLGASAVIIGCEGATSSWCARLLSWRALVFTGLISYSLYLWHWPLLAVVRIHTLGEVGASGIFLVCVCSFVLAWLTFRYIEDPIRRRRVNLMSTRRQAFRIGFSGSVAVVVAAGSLGAWAKFVWPRLTGADTQQTALRDIRAMQVSCWQPREDGTGLRADPSCTVPATAGTPKMLVWGDSHAAHLVPALREIATVKAPMRIRVMGECPPILGYSPALIGRHGSPGCESFNDAVIAEIAELHRHGLEVVILGAVWSSYLKNPTALDVARVGLQATVQRLMDVGVRVVVVAPVPIFRYDVPTCLVRRPAAQCDLPRAAAESTRALALSVLNGARQPGLQIVDPFKQLCTSTTCPAFDAGKILFSDSHHMTEHASARLIDVLRGAIALQPTPVLPTSAERRLREGVPAISMLPASAIRDD